LVDKNLIFRGRIIGKYPLRVKEKETTTYMVSGGIAVLRAIFRKMY